MNVIFLHSFALQFRGSCWTSGNVLCSLILTVWNVLHLMFFLVEKLQVYTVVVNKSKAILVHFKSELGHRDYMLLPMAKRKIFHPDENFTSSNFTWNFSLRCNIQRFLCPVDLSLTFDPFQKLLSNFTECQPNEPAFKPNLPHKIEKKSDEMILPGRAVNLFHPNFSFNALNEWMTNLLMKNRC